MTGKSERSQERRRCEFQLVRYIADRVKGEFVNIGVVLRETAGAEGQAGPSSVRFTRDWRRVRCADPDVDIAALEAMLSDIAERLENKDNGGAFLTMLEQLLSNSTQLTSAKACLAENMAAEMDVLMRLYVESQKRERVSQVSPRQSIYRVMVREFERAGVWNFMEKKIPVSTYTGIADPLRIDCAYRNGGLRMFQAMSPEDINASMALAHRAPALRKGVLQHTGLELELTVIGEPLARNGISGELEKNDDEVEFYEAGKNLLEAADIRFMTTTDLPRIAERAREELGI